MVDDAGFVTPAGERNLVPICPWCSAALPVADAAVCPSCEARLVEPDGVDVPGVTVIDPSVAAAAAAPRKVKLTFGALFVGNDHEIQPPTADEMPALAPPDLEVRREMLRLELDARLAALQAEVKAMETEQISNLDARSRPDESPPSA